MGWAVSYERGTPVGSQDWPYCRAVRVREWEWFIKLTSPHRSLVDSEHFKSARPESGPSFRYKFSKSFDLYLSRLRAECITIQGYLAHKKQRPPRTLR